MCQDGDILPLTQRHQKWIGKKKIRKFSLFPPSEFMTDHYDGTIGTNSISIDSICL